MSQKRIRSINWDEEEKQLFRMVFKEYAQIIENKSLDTNTNRTKAKAWEQVHTRFNQLNGRPRELNQLKIQWKTMKVNARKSYSAFKKETNKTGGGTRPPTSIDTIMNNQKEYVSRMLSHSKLLKDDEHLRRMEMAEEEHKIKMEINKEKLNAAILEKEINQEKLKAAMLEREMLEIRKAREAS